MKMASRGFHIEATAMFDSSLANFKLMLDKLQKLSFPIFLWPCALGDSEEAIAFRQDEQTAMTSKKTIDGSS
jgi:hypothetical protein